VTGPPRRIHRRSVWQAATWSSWRWTPRATPLPSSKRCSPLLTATGPTCPSDRSVSPALQRTTAATETIYLLINNLFATGYRRCEWKCDALHAGSRAAAERFGFLYEGAFAKATHYKGRSRDTAWYAIVDDRWPQLKAGFDHWLAPENFSDSGNQLMTLRHCLGT
jgi:hypothetical protein